MNRTERLRQFCEGRKKSWVAEKQLGIRPQLLSYLTQIDIDKLISDIDALPVETSELSPAA